jgi:TolB protein
MVKQALLCAACASVFAAGAPSARAAFPGANGRIAFESDRAGNPDVWTMDADGQNPKNLTEKYDGVDGVPAWSADGRRLVFVSDRVGPANPTADFEIFVMNADGSDQRQVTFNEQDDDWPAWAPDGDRIVFQRWLGDEDIDVFTIRANGHAEHNITRTPALLELDPVWSPDGREIAFARGTPDEPLDLYTMRPNGKHLRAVTATPAIHEQRPDWSPDGRSLAFNSPVADDDWEVYTIDADGTHRRNLTNAPTSVDGTPAWSPDGRQIAFLSDRDDGVADIFTMRTDGSGLTRLTIEAAHDAVPDWQPLPGRRS